MVTSPPPLIYEGDSQRRRFRVVGADTVTAERVKREQYMISGSDLWPLDVCEAMYDDGHGTFAYRQVVRRPCDYVWRACTRTPRTVALEDDWGTRLTFAQYEAESRSTAQLLVSVGVRRGVRVGLLMDNSVEFAVSFMAINACGGTTCPLPGKYRDEELVRLIDKAGMSVLLVEDERADALKDAAQASSSSLPPMLRCVRGQNGNASWVLDTFESRERLVRRDPPEDDVAILMFTSGTTAESKGVRLTNRAVVHAAEVYRATLGVNNSDTCLVATPLYHITGLVAIIALMAAVGGRLLIQRRLAADLFLTAIEAEQVTFVHASPSVFTVLEQARQRHPRLDSVRMLACGAAHMPVTLIRALHEWMPQMQFRTVYGLTETTSPATIMPVDAATSDKIGSSGIVVPGLDLSIRDTNGVEVPIGQTGEVFLRGTNITIGYDSIEGGGLVDGEWLATGDVGRIDEDGYLFVVDRIKDIVNRGGEKVCCVDVEEALRSVLGITDAAVVAAPHEVYGEVPVAVVVLDDTVEVTLDGMRGDLLDVLAHHEMPTAVRIVEEIPLTLGGKVDKRLIQACFDSLGRPL